MKPLARYAHAYFSFDGFGAYLHEDVIHTLPRGTGQSAIVKSRDSITLNLARWAALLPPARGLGGHCRPLGATSKYSGGVGTITAAPSANSRTGARAVSV